MPGSAAPQRPQPGAESKESLREENDDDEADDEPDTEKTESCFST